MTFFQARYDLNKKRFGATFCYRPRRFVAFLVNLFSAATHLLLFCFSCHQGEEDVEMCATELLYQGILPSLPQYMVSVVCGSTASRTLYI